MGRWKTRLNIGLVLLTACAGFLVTSRLQTLPEFSQEGFAMDSYYRVGARLSTVEQASFSQWVTSELGRLERWYTIFDSNGSQAPNAQEGQALAAKAKRYTEVSQGAYRVDIVPLARLWKAAIDEEVPPSPEDIVVAQKRIEKGQGGRDFGSLLKGYAADRIYAKLQSAQTTQALIDMGGTIRVFGRPNRWRGKWRIAIRNPRDSGTLGYFEVVSGQAVATSGDYERGFTYLGHRYHHILDPRTGYPAGDYRSVSVVAPDALSADILSTFLFVTGPTGVAAVEKEFGFSVLALFVDKEGKIELSGTLPVRWVTN